MIDCRDLWTNESNDPCVGDRLNDDMNGEYMNLGGPQLLQIFRTTIRTNDDELHDGSWLQKAKKELDRHFMAIDKYLSLSGGMIIDGTTGQVVGEGSTPTSPGMRPFRLMHGLESFKEHEGYDETWRPGLLHLRTRMIKLMKPWAPFDSLRGCDMHFVRESCWLSEVALGFRDDDRDGWEPNTILNAAMGWLEEAETWSGKDFP